MASVRSNTGLRVALLLYLASLAQAMPALGDFKYQGCYSDHNDNRSLTGPVNRNDKMTLQKCAIACKDYQWFGVEYGTQCFCGTSLASTAEKRPDTECRMKCGGNLCQVCGDGDRLNVFWTGRDATGSNLETVGNFEYKSCWTDNHSQNSLAGAKFSQNDMTVETCAELCKDFGYFGLEFSNDCFCGNQLGGESAPEEQCGYLCAGNPGQWCGGWERLNMYAAKSTTSELPNTSTSTSTSTSELSVESTTTSEALTTSETTTGEITTSETTITKPTTTIDRAGQAIQGTQCRDAFKAGVTVVPAIAACFTAPRFNGPAAYSCVAAASDVFCQVATVCKEDVGLPTGPGAPRPTNVLGEVQGGFEDGELWPAWGSGNAAPADLKVEVSSERVHGGGQALKVQFANTVSANSYFMKSVSLDPGGVYEVSWWWWSENNVAATWSEVYISGGGLSLSFTGKTYQRAPQQWQQQSATFTAVASFADVRFVLYGNDKSAANTIYLDDVQIIRVA
ncbi:hypothetical protein N0V88_005544 [Collariella sp. IMI 366227]|nr:hypothetical protein N0V88_005544 [Collariella sp. IMI 366227]